MEWLNETFGTELYLDAFSDDEMTEARKRSDYSPEMLRSLSILLSDLINRQETKAETLRRGVRFWWRRRIA